MNQHYGKIDMDIRSHYSQLACERAMCADIQERWDKACLNKTATEILSLYKTFLGVQPEILDIYQEMDHELAQNQNDYYEELEGSSLQI